jgi:hypothetical protein
MTAKLPGLHTRLPMLPIEVGPAPQAILFDRDMPAR